MYLFKILLVFFLLNSVLKENVLISQTNFKLGNEVLLENIKEIKDKKTAVLTNQTGIISDGTHIIDALVSKGVNIVKIFTPEHGIRGDESYSNIDDKTGIPVISLFGDKNKPSGEDLSDIDIIIYDIQDVGSRFYTYTSTLLYAIEAAAENKKKIIVCDRPVIINPDYVDGFMLDSNFTSFVGTINVPVCYGLTCGELANFLYGTLGFRENFLSVSKMENYFRFLDYDSLNLLWVKPSPSMFTSKTALCYPAACFLEGTNVSEGRGTEKPFEYFGAPWIDSEKLVNELNSYGLKGVSFERVTFTPSEMISAYPPKFFYQQCNGAFLNITDKKLFEPVKCGVAIIFTLYKLCPEFEFNISGFIDKLAGTDKLRTMILDGKDYNSIINEWNAELSEYMKLRTKYLLYN